MARNYKITKEGRECSKCKRFLQWDDFGKNKAHTTGHQSRCKCCTSKTATGIYTPRGSRKETFEPEKGFNSTAQLFYLGIKKSPLNEGDVAGVVINNIGDSNESLFI